MRATVALKTTKNIPITTICGINSRESIRDHTSPPISPLPLSPSPSPSTPSSLPRLIAHPNLPVLSPS